MVLYHRTMNSRAILTAGFRDAIFIDRRTSTRRVGVWLAECWLDAAPPSPRAGATEKRVRIAVDIPIGRLRQYRLVTEGRKPNRLYVVPAHIANRYPRHRLTPRQEQRVCDDWDCLQRFGLTFAEAKRYFSSWGW